MTKRIYWLCSLLFCAPAMAIEEFTLEIRDHLFFPSELTLPADRKVRLVIINHDSTPEEFDSFDLNREKVIFGNSRAVIYVGPLPAGEYHFFGEYHPDSAQGKVIVTHEEAGNAD